MKTHTNTQIIKQDGVPAFAVIDWNRYQDLLVRAGDITPNDEASYTPHEIIELIFNKSYPTVKAWRVHLGFTQQQLADKLEVSQARVAKLEQTTYTKINNTINKLANIMGVYPEQLLN